MKMKWIGSVVASFCIGWLLTGEIKWGLFFALIIGVGGAKYIRIQKHEAKNEIEYDERVNQNIRIVTLQVFSFSNLVLLVYLLFSMLVLEVLEVPVKGILIYLTVTFFFAFYIVPFIVRKR